MADKELTEGYLRSRFRDLEPGSTDEPNKAYAKYISSAPVTPLGHSEVSVGTSPVNLPTVPANTKRVVLYAVANKLTFTDDGTTPSASHGMIIPADTVFIYDTEPGSFQMRADSATDVRVAFYG